MDSMFCNIKISLYAACSFFQIPFVTPWTLIVFRKIKTSCVSKSAFLLWILYQRPPKLIYSLLIWRCWMWIILFYFTSFEYHIWLCFVKIFLHSWNATNYQPHGWIIESVGKAATAVYDINPLQFTISLSALCRYSMHH